MFASAKGKQQKQVRQLQCIDRIPYFLLGLSRAHFFRQPFSKQLYTFKSACIYKFKVYCVHVSHRPRFFHSDEPRTERYIQSGKSWDLEAICECQEFAPGLLSYLLWTMNPRRKKNRFHMFKDQESNVNKPFHLLPTRKLSISNGEVAMLAGYFACIPRYCKIHLLL